MAGPGVDHAGAALAQGGERVRNEVRADWAVLEDGGLVLHPRPARLPLQTIKAGVGAAAEREMSGAGAGLRVGAAHDQPHRHAQQDDRQDRACSNAVLHTTTDINLTEEQDQQQRESLLRYLALVLNWITNLFIEKSYIAC